MRRARTPTVGVLVMAHGTPDSPEGIESFYTAIRRGRPPTPELLDELVGRYRAIGGTSPLTARTRAQVDGLAVGAHGRGSRAVRRPLRGQVRPAHHRGGRGGPGPGRRGPGRGHRAHPPRVVAGLRRVLPAGGGGGGIADSAARAHDGPLVAPGRRAGPAPGRSDRRVPGLTTRADRRRTAVFFTAHSLPLRVVAEGDAYPDQVAESAADIAGLLGLDRRSGLSGGWPGRARAGPAIRGSGPTSSP